MQMASSKSCLRYRLCHSNRHQLASANANSAAVSQHCMYHFSKQHRRSDQSFTSDRILLPMFRSTANSGEQQIQICVVVGFRWPGAAWGTSTCTSADWSPEADIYLTAILSLLFYWPAYVIGIKQSWHWQLFTRQPYDADAGLIETKMCFTLSVSWLGFLNITHYPDESHNFTCYYWNQITYSTPVYGASEM